MVTGTPEGGTGFAAQEEADFTGQQDGRQQADGCQDSSQQGTSQQAAGQNGSGPADKTERDNLESMPTEIPEEKVIYVHVCGAVVHPGVYAATADARVVDALELAGGLTEEAAGEHLNQAQQILDGQRVYVPTKSEVGSLTAGEFVTGGEAAIQEGGDASLVNINTADAARLMTLPGIGQSKADRIIEYRSTNGKFKTIEDLMKVPGIKEGSFRQISSKISVD